MKQEASKALDAIVQLATGAKTLKEGAIRILIFSNIAVWCLSGFIWYSYRAEVGEVLFAQIKKPPGIAPNSRQDLVLRSLLNDEISGVKVVVYNYQVSAEEIKYSIPPLSDGDLTVRSFDHNDRQFEAHADYQCFSYSITSVANQSRTIVTYPFYGIHGTRNFSWPTGYARLEFVKPVTNPESVCRRLARIVPAIANLY